MARRRRKCTNKPRSRSSTPRAKAIKLNPDVWLRNPKDIALWRESLLIDQDYMCAITGLPLNMNNGVGDHDHLNGRMRGVLLSEANSLEGMFHKKFKKFKLDTKFSLDFPEFLISMGEYLQRDNSKNKFHVHYMTDLRNYIKRLTREEIASKIRSEFKLDACEKEAKGELVRRYVQAFVDLIEKCEHRCIN